MPRANGSNRAPLDRETDLAEVTRLSNLGYSQREIAEKLGLSQPTVQADLVEIKRRYREAQLENHGALIQRKLDILAGIRKEAWEAWERSKLDTYKVSKKSIPVPPESPKGGGKKRRKVTNVDETTLREMFVTEMTEVREGRLPASEYMNIILKTVEQERAILGLDEALKIDMHTSGDFWDSVKAVPPPIRSDADDPIEAEIVQVDKTALPAHRNGDHK